MILFCIFIDSYVSSQSWSQLKNIIKQKFKTLLKILSKIIFQKLARPSGSTIADNIDSMHSFNLRNFIYAKNTIDDYDNRVISKTRLFWIILGRFACLLNTIRFGFTAIINTVSLNSLDHKYLNFLFLSSKVFVRWCVILVLVLRTHEGHQGSSHVSHYAYYRLDV